MQEIETLSKKDLLTIIKGQSDDIDYLTQLINFMDKRSKYKHCSKIVWLYHHQPLKFADLFIYEWIHNKAILRNQIPARVRTILNYNTDITLRDFLNKPDKELLKYRGVGNLAIEYVNKLRKDFNITITDPNPSKQ